MHQWLADLRHDLLKRLLWLARDLQQAQIPPVAADRLRLQKYFNGLTNGEGQSLTATALWRELRREAPAEIPVETLDHFERTLNTAAAAVTAAPLERAVEAILSLEPAFHALARFLEDR